MIGKVGEMRPGGNTPLYRHVVAAANRLLAERTKNNNIGSYKLLVITDGYADNDDAVLNEDGKFPDGSIKPGVLKDVLSRCIMVDAIGIDMREDHPLKNQINGSYMRADDPDSLVKAVTKAVAEVGFSASPDVAEEAFKDVAEMPVPFALAAIKAITTFPNHPIGEQPSAPAISEGQPAKFMPGAAQEIKSGPSTGGTILIVGIIIVVVLVVVCFVACLVNRDY